MSAATEARRRVPVHEGGEDVGGWAGAVMRWLRTAARLVAVNLLVLTGTLLGGVVLGVLPALGAASAVLAAMAAGDPPESVTRAFGAAYREGFRRANRLGWPLLVVGAVLAADALALPLLASGAGTGPAAVAAAGLLALGSGVLVVGAWFLAALRRYDEPFGRTWRFLLLAPAASPGTALAVLVTLGALAFAGWHLTPLLPLLGASAAVLLTGVVVDRRLDAIDGTPSA
ncbi:DUF624 domain-containing protein [Cellulomonas pakistanensis]|uniref:DUF624 domain-containing protein n=1 Tax=Cellulomonas pakistanensis TaxID=992287 RepID=A0A919PAJ1_9CELL|nr:DUF624 domain-containing protein [Cellulomonas pakistanensis]GIG36020.1 hypothetical protein Cpa01nite_14010 [Cellulomonas pakistanensis]